jgi:hypothetical protein
MSSPETFFDGLIDDFGIYHHTDGQNWLKSTGYSLDDAARGLILCLARNDLARAKVLFGYVGRSRDGSDFYGFASASQQFNTYPASEDAKGQVVWALGYGLSKNFMAAQSRAILSEVQASLPKMQHIRGYAYTLLGAIYFDLDLAGNLAGKICDSLNDRTSGWFWPEDQLTYGNGILPYSLLRYSLVSGDKAAGQTGRKMLDFLQQCCQQDRILGPIGNEGWFKKTASRPAEYSQQPVDAAYMVLAWLAEYQLSSNKISLTQAQRWLDWFEGDNIAGKKMYLANNLKCFDGIDKTGINQHSGAESNICLLLARHLYKDRTTV